MEIIAKRMNQKQQNMRELLIFEAINQMMQNSNI